MTGSRIRHMVVFNLMHKPGSTEELSFLRDGERLLKSIPVVENFEVLRQVSPKADFAFGFSMEFADRQAYETYNSHPTHAGFVEERWVKEVDRFQEIDFAPLVR